MMKNTAFMKKFKPEETAAVDSLHGMLHRMLLATGKTQEDVDRFMEESGVTKGRFYKAMMKAFTEGKINYATALMKLTLYEGRWHAMMDTPAGKQLITAWKQHLHPVYDPSDKSVYSIPILFPIASSNAFQQTHQWMREMVNMKWAMIEGSFTIDGTSIYILKVADIAY